MTDIFRYFGIFDEYFRQLGARQQPNRRPLDPIPSIEWWDAPFIATYDDVSAGKFVVRGDKITHLEEHPVMIEPPTEKSDVPTVPLYLTKQVRFNSISIQF